MQLLNDIPGKLAGGMVVFPPKIAHLAGVSSEAEMVGGLRHSVI